MKYKREGPQPIAEYMKKFLSSDSNELMEYCYAAVRDSEQNRFHRNQIEILEDNQFDTLFSLVSCVILTANKIECDSLNYILSQQDDVILVRRKHPLYIFEGSDFGAPEAYIIEQDSSVILHLRAYEAGSNTPGGSTDLVRYISNNRLLRPNLIISFGICYGRDSKSQNIGDVIIPKKLYPWSIGQKFIDESEGMGGKKKTKFLIKHDNFNLNLEEEFSSRGIYSSLRDLCNNDENECHISSQVAFTSKEKTICRRDFSVKISLGDMSTGEAVVSSAKAKEAIKESTKNDRELGGDMEGYGLAKECIYYAHIPCLIVKAICDWGEDKNIDQLLEEENIAAPPYLKDKLQAYASFCAGVVLIRLLKRERKSFLTLNLLKWMGEKKHLNICTYAEKENIVRNIKNFYHVSADSAEKIFGLLEHQKIVVRVENAHKYHVNPKLLY